jgi:hypothetical protein
VAVLLAAALPATGQDPPPPCAPDAQLTPDRFQFESRDNPNVAKTSLTVGHPATAYFNVSDKGAWLPSASRITGPPGLDVTAHNGSQDAHADFTPTTPGPLTFTATWTQTHEPDQGTCTGSATASVTATAPKPVRVLRTIGYTAGFGQFVLTALVAADRSAGDTTPIRMTVRVVKSQRRPPASAPPTVVTFDPNGPTRGVRAKTPLMRLHAYSVDTGNAQSEYKFEVGVPVRAPHGSKARRGVEMILSQGSRTLTTIRFATACAMAHGGVFCYPLPKGSA